MSNLKRIQDFAELLIRDAEEHGFVVTITPQNLQPWAMGHHKMVAEVKESHSKYRAKEREKQLQNLEGECMKSVCDDRCSYPNCIRLEK